MFIKTILLLFLVFIYPIKGVNFKFEHLMIEDGLSQSTVFDIMQDSEGFLWFATQDGLNRYDGYSFKIYYADEKKSNCISDNTIHVIREDSHGNLWIGTAGGGLNKLNSKTGKFAVYRYDAIDDNSISSDYISALLIDKEGIIWVGTIGGGLNKFDPYTGEFVYYLTQEEGSVSVDISSIFRDSRDQLWVGTRKHLYKFSAQSNEFIDCSIDLSKDGIVKVSEIYEDRTGSLWIGVDSYGLIRFFPGTKEQIHYRFDPLIKNGLSNDQIRALYELESGKLLIGTFGGGICLLDPISEKFSHYKNDAKNEFSISNNHVISIYKDEADILWIGTIKGINRVDLKPEKFATYKIETDLTNPADVNTTGVNFVTSILQDTNKEVWLGTHATGLFRLNMDTGSIMNFHDNGSRSNGLRGMDVWALHMDRHQTLWIGTSIGLNEYDIQKNKFRLHRLNEHKDSPRGTNAIRSIIEDGNNNLWIGFYGRGLHRFSPQSGQFTSFSHQVDNKFKNFSNNILSLCRDHEDKIWIGTDGAGLYMFNPEVNSYQNHLNTTNYRESLPSDRINAIHEDNRGNLWLATSKGLVVLDQDKKPLQSFSTVDGLANSFVYAIQGDNKDNIWLSSNRGLTRVKLSQEGEVEFSNYDAEDGLQSNEFNTNCSYRGLDGMLFFGGINGFNSFYPDQVKSNKHVPKISITTFTIQDKIQDFNPSKSQIEIDYDQNNFSFEFSALDFSNPLKNQYAYKLEGFEDDWVYSGNRRYVNYTNLDIGEYIFRVKGSNNDGVWNEEGTWARIRIIPPIWKTSWAYISYALIFITIIISIVKWRSFKLERDNQRLENKVSEKTEELKISYERLKVSQKDEIQSAKLRAMGNLASGMAHDFNNILTIVLGSAQLLKMNLSQEKNIKLAQNIETAALDGTDIIKKIQDFSRNEADTATSQVDINQILSDVIEVTRFKWIDQKQIQDITISFETDFSSLPEIKVNASEIRLVFTNIIINAIEAFEKSGKIFVKTGIVGDKWICIQIVDQGKGMDRDTLNHIFDPFYSTKGEEGYGLGLSQVYGIISRLRGHIDATSQMGKGTEMTIKLPVSLANKINETNTKDATEVLDSIKGRQILIVEDEAIIRELYDDILSKEGYQLVMAATGEDGLKEWQKSRFDLIICDLGLPGMSGWEFIRFIREDNNEIPIIALTGWGDMISPEKADAYDVNKVVSKPVKISHLLNHIHELVVP
jgi:ligand-binding sensor domain-containing protein/signal transduction histidine kinase